MDLIKLKEKTPAELLGLIEKLGIEGVTRNRKQDLVLHISKHFLKKGETIHGGGTLEVLQEGYGFLRSSHASYMASLDDLYVSPKQIRQFNMRSGDTVLGQVRLPRDGERYFAINQIDSVNGLSADQRKSKIDFEHLTPLFPDQRIRLERNDGTTTDISTRILDMISPVGRGQRGLIVSPPKAGKTMMLQSIAESVAKNHPEAVLMVLLIDERPEEVTEMRRSVKGEVIASTFDESPTRHVQVAEMVIAKAKRLVENKQDVIILLDSITRLARAYNTMTPSSGKVLTGGVDANALQRPKRFFGAARNVEEGGSLTILATALVETGSRMDDVIYEEFKGTGNMEVHLERSIANKRIYPAINVLSSGTRREDKITSEDDQRRTWILRKYLSTLEDQAAIEFLIDRLKKHKTNELFFETMKGS
jgi:transcription termination factor Rho